MFDRNLYTTLWISKKTRDRINEIAVKPQSYDDVLNMLLDGYKKGNRKKRAVEKMDICSGIKND